MCAVTGTMAVAAVTSAALTIGFKVYAKHLRTVIDTIRNEKQLSNYCTKIAYKDPYFGNAKKTIWKDEIFNTKADYSKWFTAGFTVALIIFAAVSTYLTYRDMQAQYKVDFTPIPLYMVVEKDLIEYNSKSEKIILKNQSAYYEAVKCNRTSKDEMFKNLGI